MHLCCDRYAYHAGFTNPYTRPVFAWPLTGIPEPAPACPLAWYMPFSTETQLVFGIPVNTYGFIPQRPPCFHRERCTGRRRHKYCFVCFTVTDEMDYRFFFRNTWDRTVSLFSCYYVSGTLYGAIHEALFVFFIFFGLWYGRNGMSFFFFETPEMEPHLSFLAATYQLPGMICTRHETENVFLVVMGKG